MLRSFVYVFLRILILIMNTFKDACRTLIRCKVRSWRFIAFKLLSSTNFCSQIVVRSASLTYQATYTSSCFRNLGTPYKIKSKAVPLIKQIFPIFFVITILLSIFTYVHRSIFRMLKQLLVLPNHQHIRTTTNTCS